MDELVSCASPQGCRTRRCCDPKVTRTPALCAVADFSECICFALNLHLGQRCGLHVCAFAPGASWGTTQTATKELVALRPARCAGPWWKAQGLPFLMGLLAERVWKAAMWVNQTSWIWCPETHWIQRGQGVTQTVITATTQGVGISTTHGKDKCWYLVNWCRTRCVWRCCCEDTARHWSKKGERREHDAQDLLAVVVDWHVRGAIMLWEGTTDLLTVFFLEGGEKPLSFEQLSWGQQTFFLGKCF